MDNVLQSKRGNQERGKREKRQVFEVDVYGYRWGHQECGGPNQSTG